MALANKVATQLMIEPDVKSRAQALAIVQRTSVAQIYRQALDLTPMERVHAVRVTSLIAGFEARGIPWTEGVDLMVRNHLRLKSDGSLPDDLGVEGDVEN